MLKRVIVAGVAALVAAGFLAPVSVDARNLDDIIKAGTIKIGVHPNGGVRSQINPKGEWEGFDIDISERLGEMLGVKVEYVPTETPQRIPNLVSDRTDIQLGALTRTPDRMKVIDYTPPSSTRRSRISNPGGISTVKTSRRPTAVAAGRSSGCRRTCPRSR